MSIVELIEISGASMLLTIMLLLTKKKWAGGYKLIIIFIGGIITGYFFSTIPAYYIPELYKSTLGTAIRGGSTIVGFMFLVYIFEKDIFTEVFERLKKKEIDSISNNN